MADQLIKLPFSDQEYASRVEKVRQQMGEQRLDLLLVTVRENTYYLTGFQGINPTFQALAVPARGEPAWIVRKTELSNIRTLAPISWVKEAHGVADTEDPIQVLGRVLRHMGHERSRIGLEQEGSYFTIAYYLRLRKEMPDAEFVDASRIISSLRKIKSEAELRYMRQAGEITAKAVGAGIEALHEGVTDTEIGSVLLATATLEGSEKMCAGPEVTAGKRSFLAHSSWAGIPICRGEIVNMEMAATVARYNAPVFRISVIGEPSDEVRRFHDASLAGLRAGLENFQPGMTSGEADSIVRRAVEQAGYGDYFPVRAAYGVGIGFSPSWGEDHVMAVRPGDPRPLERGMCFHLVPALYKGDLGCVCCSMAIEITDKGAAPLVPLEPKLFVR